ncbi:uncharacterized protein LOC141898447 [Tubulanus polymorphus]|uniref:uncharacterized protein LOC141898447 n=1 Tax=Tubulanus polymorphus TaxID=672921 RepID=UPI003DA3A742
MATGFENPAPTDEKETEEKRKKVYKPPKIKMDLRTAAKAFAFNKALGGWHSVQVEGCSAATNALISGFLVNRRNKKFITKKTKDKAENQESVDEDDEKWETCSITENPVDEPAVIVSPFDSSQHKKQKKATYSCWKMPNFMDNIERNSRFKFARPESWIPPGDSPSVVSPTTQVHQLQLVLQQKERELVLYRQQLKKAHLENYKIIKLLQGFTGDQYEELLKENQIVKGHMARLSRENQRLVGMLRQTKNPKIAEMQLLDKLHQTKISNS